MGRDSASCQSVGESRGGRAVASIRELYTEVHESFWNHFHFGVSRLIFVVLLPLRMQVAQRMSGGSSSVPPPGASSPSGSVDGSLQRECGRVASAGEVREKGP